MDYRIYHRIAYIILYLSISLPFICGLINTQQSTKKAINKSSFDWSSVSKKTNIVPLAVIGSGPAGLSAAMYGARAGIKSVVFEGDFPGGLLTKTSYVENWPGIPHVLGPKVMKRLRKQACSFGVQCVFDTIEEINFSDWPFVIHTAEGDIIHALTVIIATGAHPRHLYVEGEEEYWGRGVSSCARCDAPLYKNKEVIVVGGGDSAIEEALQLVPYAKKVTIVHRRNQLRASPHMRERISSYKEIDVLYDSSIKQIIGNGDEVTAVELINSQTGEISTMMIDGVFLAIGHDPNTKIFKNYISTDEQGYIVLEGRSQATNIPGVFAAGDVADPCYRQAGSAAGDGIKAGIDAILFLHEIGFTTQRAHEMIPNMFNASL
jgi:thioredoxin reductase (NADPH)